MSGMLIPIVGKLESEPTLTPAFNEQRFMLKNHLITERDDGTEHEARVPIVAWDEVAEEIMKYHKNDTVHLLCEASDSSMNVCGTAVIVMGFRALMVDHSGRIAIEVNKKIMEHL